MNGENNHIYHPSALDGQRFGREPPRLTWALFAAQLWLLAAFVAMSLVAIAAKRFLAGPVEAQPAAAPALGLAGAVLTPVAWRNVARQLGRAELELAADAEPASSSGAGRLAPGKPPLLVAHR
jgi:hypothetical protein